MTAEQTALIRLRVELYGAAQVLKGQDLADLKELIAEIALLLEVNEINKPAVPT